MLYNGYAVNIPACSSTGSHYQKDKSICTLQAFMKQVKSVSMTADEYKKACHSDIVIDRDWD